MKESNSIETSKNQETPLRHTTEDLQLITRLYASMITNVHVVIPETDIKNLVMLTHTDSTEDTTVTVHVH